MIVYDPGETVRGQTMRLVLPSVLRRLVLLLVLGIGVALGRMFDGVTNTAEAAGGQESFASESGDVNADGAVDISDAITMLGYLFLGNPPQLPPLRSTQAHSGLPDTGQTICYDTVGNVIDCESDTWPGQDGFYATGCPSEGCFIDNGDGRVTDACTGLMCLQETADINGDGEVTPTPSSGHGDYGPDGATWQEALQYCEELEFAGHRDWRLPNGRELDSIVDYERDEPFPSISAVFEAESFSGVRLARELEDPVAHRKVAMLLGRLEEKESFPAEEHELIWKHCLRDIRRWETREKVAELERGIGGARAEGDEERARALWQERSRLLKESKR